MAIPLSQVVVRRLFARANANGEPLDYASLDAIHADLSQAINLVVLSQQSFLNPSGTVRYGLGSSTRFTATTSQTAFTVPAYNTATDLPVVSINGLRLDPNSITRTNGTTVTIPAQTAGTVVVIDIQTPGNGSSALSSTTAGQGASLVGLSTDANFTSTQVQAALSEIAGNLASAAYLGGVLTISNYVRKDGTVTFTANQPMGTFKLTGLGAGTSNGDSVRYEQIQSAALQATLNTYLSGTYLALAGGTMAGSISMGGSYKLTNLAAGTTAGDSVRYNEFIAINASQITAGTLAAALLPVFLPDSGGVAGTKGAVPAPPIGAAAAQNVLLASGVWGSVPTNIGSGYAVLVNRVASGNDGQAGVATVWTAINVQTTLVNTNTTAISLSGNQIVLQAGTYRIHVKNPCFAGGANKLRLFNVTDAVVVEYGVNENAGAAQTTSSTELWTRFAITGTKNFRIDHWVATTSGATAKFGTNVGDGSVETYLTVEVTRE